MFRQGSAYIDGTGQYVIGPMWDIWPVGDFHDGLANVRVKSDDKHGYIDKSGNLVIKPQWDGAYDFKDGNIEIQLQDWKSVSCFNEGFSWVCVNNAYKLIKYTGEVN